ncbi:MAG TPA: DUF2845 domain-containing protein [Dongiaceae bacterium]|nr:DUF2845 domain-containing protein [Dongiaceae bacterium]
MKWIFGILVVVILFSAERSFADNFRCPNGNIVSTGDSISTVAAKCDPPAGTFKREEPVVIDLGRTEGRMGSKVIYIEVQEWIYNQGSTLLHTLIFRNGVLAEVRTGGFVQ